MTGPASLETLYELLHATAKQLLRRVKGTPTVSELSVARHLLRDQGVSFKPTDEAEQKRLIGMRKLYIRRLHEALEVDQPSAAVLREVLAFLSAADMVDGIGSHIEARRALAQLTAADLPFH